MDYRCVYDPENNSVLCKTMRFIKLGDGFYTTIKEVSIGTTISDAMGDYESYLINKAYGFETTPRIVQIRECETRSYPDGLEFRMERIPLRTIDRDAHRWTILYGKALGHDHRIMRTDALHRTFFERFIKRSDRSDFKYLCYGTKSHWRNKDVRKGSFNHRNIVANGDWMAVKDDQTMVMARLSFDFQVVMPMGEVW